MKHGAFHNYNCRACRIMYRITYYISMSVGIVIAVFLIHNHMYLHQYKLVVFCLFIPLIIHMANRITVHIAPKTHGMYLDACGDTSWYRPKHAK